jgi:peptide/nickel transport system substrate-binding protein
MKKKAFIALFIIASFAIMSAYNANTINAVQEPIANLVFKTNSGNPVRGDYGLFIAQYLRDIGIELEVKLEEWSVFVGELTLSHDYDCGIVGISGGAISPDFRSAYSEDGTLNLFGLEREMPYQNQSENLQLEATTITDLAEQQQMYY